MKIQDILDASPHLLREITLNISARSEARNEGLLFTIALWRIREEKLFLEWHHKSFFWYCRTELQLTPMNSESWRIALYTRLQSRDCTTKELESIQKLGIRTRKLITISKIFQTKTEILEACQHPEKFTEERRKNHARLQFTLGPFRVSRLTSSLVYDTFTVFRRRFSLHQPQCLIALALTCKILMETKPEERHREMRRLCLFYDLDMQVADFMFGGEAWRGQIRD